MPTPLIFLDIDGVLNSNRTVVPRNQPPLDPLNIKPFNRIIAETKAQIVISSLWRFSHSIDEIASMFLEVGIEGSIIDVTPLPKSNIDHRGTEVYEWIRVNRLPNWSSESGNFVILDDRTDLEPYLDRHILTDFDCGLTEDNADNAIALLM
jgi:hypothetical protein